MRANQLQRGVYIGMLILAAFWLASLIAGLAGKAQIAIEEAHNAKTEYQALEERKIILQANLSALETERGIDESIRTTFGVARPGEEVIVVLPSTPAASTTPSSWWQKILNWFY
jgi:cell division protein FtsB